ncbi:psychosine receptor [Rhinophrynus dorsalis]
MIYLKNCSINHDLDQYMFPVIYIIVVVVSIPTNCLALYVSYIQVRKKNELGVYLFNLSFADLLYTLILPFWVDFSLHHNVWRFSEVLCSMSTFLMHTNFYSSAGFLTCISLDRYLAVVYPLRFSHLRTRKTAVMVSCVVWVIQLSSNAVILGKPELFNMSGDLSCFDVFPMENWQSNLNIVNVCIGHLLPLCAMLFCYQRIFAAVKTNQATADHDKRKIKQLLLTIVVTFILSFTPYHVVVLLRSIWEPGNCDFAQKMFYPYKVTLASASINCVADPLLYCFVSEAGREDVRAIAYCCAKPSEPSEKNEYMLSAISASNTQEKGVV